MIETLPPDLKQVLLETPELRKAYLVGGCVRDWLLSRNNKDYDIEVFNLDYDGLVRSLSRWGRTDLVGKSFGVVKLTTSAGSTYDFTLPRRDSKKGPGHTGFKTEVDGSLDLKDAAARRDFTINSLMFDVRSQVLLDFFDGEADLRGRILRHTSTAFVEDPLRVLRGMQFAARFELQASIDTIVLCRQMKNTFSELPVERVQAEWAKWAAQSVKPSLGLQFLDMTEWIEHFPALAALRGVPQELDFHPEGDVFIHTCHCCDAMSELAAWKEADEETRKALMLAILTHDFGKPSTTERMIKKGVERITAHGHEQEGGPIAQRFLEAIGAPNRQVERVVPLVVNHMVHLDDPAPKVIRKLANRLSPETIDHLALVMEADQRGRPPKKPNLGTVHKLLERARGLQLEHAAPKPILQGRHLLEAGWVAGPEMGIVLKAAFEAQLQGEFTDLPGGIEWMRKRPQSGSDTPPGAAAQA